jgi:hypothetical protein
MRTLLLLLACWAGLHAAEPAWYAVAVAPPVTAPPGTPVYTITGGLQCGLRMNSGTQAQAWCFDSATGLILLYNTAIPIMLVAGESNNFAFSYIDPASGVNSAIIWVLTVTDPQLPIQYLVYAAGCAIGPPGQGGIDCSTGSLPPIQSGTIQ